MVWTDVVEVDKIYRDIVISYLACGDVISISLGARRRHGYLTKSLTTRYRRGVSLFRLSDWFELPTRIGFIIYMRSMYIL